MAIQNVQTGRLKAANLTKSDFEQWLNHPVLLEHYSWTSSSSHVQLDDLIALYLAAIAGSSLAAKIGNLYYLDCKIRIKVVIQGQPYAAGQIVFSFTPLVNMRNYGTITDIVETNNLVNAKVVPHLVVDPSKTETYEIDLPVCTPNNLYALKGSGYGSYTMDIFPYNPLTSGTAVSPVVGVCVYMSLVEPKLQGMTLLSSEFANEKKPGGFLSNFAKGVGKYSPLLSVGFPQFAPEISIFSEVASGVGNVLALLGFSKPPLSDHQTFTLNRMVDNYSQFDGKSTGMVLAGSQSTALSINPDMAGAKLDDHLLASIRNIKGLVSQTLIPQSSGLSTLVASFPISPMLPLPNTDGIIRISPLTGSCMPFNHWTGDIKVTFEFVASVYHRATFLIAWDPGNLGATPTLANAVTTLQNVTVNISGNTTVEILIPWKQLYPWGLINGIDAGSFSKQNVNGEIYIYVINPVTTNGSTDGIWFNLYYSSDNIKTAVPFSEPLQSNYAQTRTAPATLLSSEFCPVTSIDFGGKTDLSYAELKSFGESYSSIKQMTSKLVTANTSSAVIASANVQPWLEGVFPNYPRGLFAGDLGNIDATIYETFSSWFAKAFLGYRGGMRYALHVNEDTTQPPISHQHYWVQNDYETGLADITDLTFTPTTTPYTWYSGTTYAFTTTNRQISPNADFTMPGLIPLDFVPTRVRSTSFCNVLQYAIGKSLASSETVANHVTATLFQGTADDGMFVWFLGFPAINGNI